MSEYDAILSALDSIRRANHDSHNDIRKSIDEGLKAVQINVDANATVTNDHIDGIVKRLDKLNGSVAELWEESNRRQIAVTDFRRLEGRLLSYKKKWMYFVVVGVAVILAVVVIYDLIGLRGIVEIIK